MSELINVFDLDPCDYYFRFDKYTCFKEAHHFCPVENMTIKEILAYPPVPCSNERSSYSYCIGIAQAFLTHKFEYSFGEKIKPECFIPIELTQYGCGHCLSDSGQHRLCIAALLKRQQIIESYFPVKMERSSITCQCCTGSPKRQGYVIRKNCPPSNFSHLIYRIYNFFKSHRHLLI